MSLFADAGTSQAQKSDSNVDQGVVVRVPKRDVATLYRRDRWFNPRNRFGGNADPMAATRFTRRGKISRGILDDMFREDWITRSAVESPAKDATRKWITFIPQADNEKARTTIESELRRLRVREAFRSAKTEARLYGGSVIVMGAFDGSDVNEPLELDRIRSVGFVNEVDRFLANPLTFINDPEDPDFGRPELYFITQAEVGGSRSKDVHASRVLRFEGEFLPKLERISNFGWGDSVVEKMLEALRQYGVAMQSGASVLQDFVTKTFKIGNLKTLMAQGGFAKVEERLAEAAVQQSIHNIIAIGEDEGIEKLGTPITQLHKLMELFITNISAASGVPKSRLFNAQGNSLGSDGGASADLLNYYDDIRSLQETEFRVLLDRAIDIVGAPHGITAEDVPYEFAPLQEQTEKERAETRLANAQADQLYVDMGALDSDEVAIARFTTEGDSGGDIMIDMDRRRAFNDNPPPDEEDDDE